MAQQFQGRKRKAITRDIETEDVIAPGDEFRNESFEGILSDSDAESHQSGSESEQWGEGLDDESDTGDEDLTDGEGVSESDSEDIRAHEAIRGEDAGRGVEEYHQPENFNSRMDDLQLNYKIATDANGNLRYIYKEIDPVYDSDDSDAPAQTNTIGNIPLSFYDSYPHIGYDINGKKIMRPARGQALDALLDSIEIPKGWTGLTDPATGKPLELNQEELEVLKKITRNEIPEDGYDPYPDYVDYFSGKTEIMPLSAAPEPKRRFVPSKNEAKRIMKIVKAIKEGRIKPYRPPTEEETDENEFPRYDLWADETPRPDHIMHIPAPKLPPPGYEESYHPPPEYLPDKNERAAWESTDPEDRDKEYLPQDYGVLRKVPGYDNVKMTFERCLDLYLAPRVRRSKLNIDPESLLPKLPSPDELRPFPTTCSTIFRGHEGRVRTVSVDPTGEYIASGGDDGTIRIWDILTGRQVWSTKLSGSDPVDVIRWRPGRDQMILAAAVQEHLYFIVPYGLPSLT